MTMAVSLPHPRTSDLSGVALAATSFAVLTAVDTLFKLLATRHPAYQILTINGASRCCPSSAGLSSTEGRHNWRPRAPCCISCASPCVSFGAVGYFRLCPPAFDRLLRHRLCRPSAGYRAVGAMAEVEVHRARWLAIGAGFIGVLLVANPFKARPGGPAPNHSPYRPPGGLVQRGRLCRFGNRYPPACAPARPA